MFLVICDSFKSLKRLGVGDNSKVDVFYWDLLIFY